MFKGALLFLGLFLMASASDYTPPYIVPCSRTHNFNECALKNAQYALPYLIKGDRRLKIPSMDPVKVDLVELKGTSHLNLKLKNVEIYGIDKLKFLNVTADFDKRRVRTISFLEKTIIKGDYEIDGRIMIIPITGHGPLSLTMYDTFYQYDSEWDLATRNGKQYAYITSNKYDYIVNRITYDFKNLFNGDKMLGEQMNKFLNDNWKLVNADLKEPFLETLLAYHNDVSEKIFSQIPYNKLFLD